MSSPTYKTLRPVLESMADEAYRAFHIRLVPGIHDFLGIRIPRLRKFGSELAKEFVCCADWIAFLEQTPVLYEEILLRGILIGRMPPQMIGKAADTAQEDSEEYYFRLIASHVRYIDNWALCDCYCSGLRQKAFLNNAFFNRISGELLQNPDAGCWAIRVGLILMLSHFIDSIYIDRVLAACRNAAGRIPEFRYEDTFYVRMGIAWLLAECYVKQRPQTHDFLFGAASSSNLSDNWTFNKAIQKITESSRIDPEEKAMLKTLRRK